MKSLTFLISCGINKNKHRGAETRSRKHAVVLIFFKEQKDYV